MLSVNSDKFQKIANAYPVDLVLRYAELFIIVLNERQKLTDLAMDDETTFKMIDFAFSGGLLTEDEHLGVPNLAVIVEEIDNRVSRRSCQAFAENIDTDIRSRADARNLS